MDAQQELDAAMAAMQEQEGSLYLQEDNRPPARRGDAYDGTGGNMDAQQELDAAMAALQEQEGRLYLQ